MVGLDVVRGPARPRQALFQAEERNGLAFAFYARTIALAAIAAWLLYIVPAPRVLFYLGVVLAFFVLGLIPYLLRRRASGLVWQGVFALLDVGVLTYVLIMPNPLSEPVWPLQMRLRFTDFLYMIVYLAWMALSYSPWLVLWTGGAIAGAWSIGVHHLLTLPDTVTLESAAERGIPVETLADQLPVILDPRYVNIVVWQNQIALLLITTCLLAAAVWRARRHLLRQVDAETARGNLARYFSPNLVGRLAQADLALDIGRTQQVGVLFVDIVGFTKCSERLTPDAAIRLLRGFHGRMAKIVFRHDGTVDKYIGDALMATFGTPSVGSNDATRALACAQAMLAEVAAWNAKRARRGAEAIDVGIGVHYGPVVVGNVGDRRRLEFTVVGDPVNVAARLERATREHGAAIVTSGELMDAVLREAGQRAVDHGAFAPLGTLALPGRAAPIDVWALKRPVEAPPIAGTHIAVARDTGVS